MTDQHPLTDEICDSIASPYYNPYGVDYDDLRAAADWQLEQVLKWLNKTIFERSLHEAKDLPEELAQAMRPTTTQENNNG